MHTHPLLPELERIVRLLSRRPGVRLTVDPQCPVWSFNFVTEEVTANPADLVSMPEDACRGLALHETAHALVTCLHEFLPTHFQRDPAVRRLLNVVEDCRIELWMGNRLPGCRPWIRAYNDALFRITPDTPLPPDRVRQFLSGILHRWWWNKVPAVRPEVAQALDAIWPTFERAIQAQPPVLEDVSDDPGHHYWIHPVAKQYLARDAKVAPSVSDMERRLSQHALWSEVFSGILPVFDRLRRADAAEGYRIEPGWKLFATEHQDRSSDHLMGHVVGPTLRPNALSGRLPTPPPFAGLLRPVRPTPRQPAQGAGGEMDRPPPRVDSDRYMEIWAKLQPQIDWLANRLLTVFLPRGRMRWMEGFESGIQPSLRKAMQAEASSDAARHLWKRKNRPERIDPTFAIVVDRSGSMCGAPIEAALEAFVLLVEVCTRVGIPLGVWTFANDVSQEFHFGDTPSPQVREQLGSIPERCGGGTDLTAALEEVRAALDHPAQGHDRFVVVLSDGQPNDEDSTRRLIQQLQQDGVHVIGLGIGEGTEEMGTLFPESTVGLRAEALPQVFADLVQRVLRLPSAAA